MKGYIKNNGLKFKIGSFEWLNYFGFSTGLLTYSLITLFFIFKSDDVEQTSFFKIEGIYLFIFGICAYLFQSYRLQFKRFKLVKDFTKFRDDVATILINNNWKIDYNNNQFLQATFDGSLFNMDMLTLKFSKTEVKWNVIRSPYSHNSIAALITLNLQGNRVVKKIKEVALEG